MEIKTFIISVAIVAAAIVGAVSVVAHYKGTTVFGLVELGTGIVAAKSSRHTIADRVAAILAKKPHLKDAAVRAGGKLRILVFKSERMVELWAPGWKVPRKYPMTAFSGTLGPKLREGDGQIPEGV